MVRRPTATTLSARSYSLEQSADYVVEADGADTLFTWVVAIEPKGALAPPIKVIAPAVKAGFGRIPIGGQQFWAKNSRRG